MIHPPVLSDAELAAYHEHGYVRLGKVAPDEEIEALCRRIDDIMLGKIRYDNMLMQLCPSAGKPELSKQTKVFKGSTLKYRKVQDLEQDPLFLPYIQHPLFRDITRKIIGEEVSAFRTMFFNKPAGRESPSMASGRRGRLEVEHPAQGDHLDGAGCDERRQRLSPDYSGLAQDHDPREGRPVVTGGTSHTRAGRKAAVSVSGDGRGRAAPQLDAAPLGRQHHEPPAAGIQRMLRRCGDLPDQHRTAFSENLS